MIPFISPEWSTPPDQRELTPEGARVYLGGELSLGDQFSLWCWLHDLQLMGQVADALGDAAESYLQVLDEFPDIKATLFLSAEDEESLFNLAEDERVEGLIDRINDFTLEDPPEPNF